MASLGELEIMMFTEGPLKIDEVEGSESTEMPNLFMIEEQLKQLKWWIESGFRAGLRFFCGSSDTLRTRNSRLAKPDSKPKAVVAKMLRDRTRARLVQIQSLIEAGADARETSDRVHALSNATLVDALQHPDATLRILTGEPDNAQTDQDALIAACNGDVELANDLFHSAGRNLQVALSLVQSSSTSDSDANFAHNSVDPVVDLTDGVLSKAQDSSTGNNKSGSSGSLSLSAQEADDLEALVNFCQGDRDLARDVFENVGRDLPKALQFLGM